MTMFNKEERTYWIENYKKFPTANISDAMDNLGFRSGVVLGLHALDVYQPRTAGFAKTIRQMRRKTAFDGKALTKQASIIDTQTEYGDLLVIEATGLRYRHRRRHVSHKSPDARRDGGTHKRKSPRHRRDRRAEIPGLSVQRKPGKERPFHGDG